MIEFFINNKDIILPLLFGSIFLILGYYINNTSEKLEKKGTKTTGHVINYYEDYYLEKGITFPKINYYPIIVFTDSKGKKHQVTDDFGTSIKSKKKLPYLKEITYFDENGEIIISSNNEIKGGIGVIFIILGLVIIIFTTIDYLIKHIN